MLQSYSSLISEIKKFLTTAPLPPVLVLLGPTASGKTALSLRLAHEFDGEIISADSRQVYREIDVSSAKITPAEMQNVPHHLLDLRSPDQTLNTAEWKELAEKKIRDCHQHHKTPIVCGGTMLYLTALTQNYDFGQSPPDLTLRTHLENTSTTDLATQLQQLNPTDAKKINPLNQRHLVRAIEITLSQKQKKKHPPVFSFFKIGIHWPRTELYARINTRAESQFKHGLIAETQTIIQKYHPNLPALTSFGYTEIIPYLNGKTTYAEALRKNQQRNRNYAKRQMTWWKNEPDIFWISGQSLLN